MTFYRMPILEKYTFVLSIDVLNNKKDKNENTHVACPIQTWNRRPRLRYRRPTAVTTAGFVAVASRFRENAYSHCFLRKVNVFGGICDDYGVRRCYGTIQ